MAKPEFDIVVIGGGAGGLVVAAGGATLGAKIALVERHRLGGECLWTGCIPSKALLKSARIAHEMRCAERWGIAAAKPPVDLVRVLAHVRETVAEVAQHDTPERFRSLGVEVIFGEGRFVGPGAFKLGARTLTARAFVLATGSRPTLPAIAGLAERPHLTNETVFDLDEPVPSLAILGAGPIGCELAQAFARLGSSVTLVELAPQLLPREDPDLAAVVQQALENEGVRCLLASSTRRVGGVAGALELEIERGEERQTLRASHLLVATGRKANLAGLGLAAAKVAIAQGALTVNGRLQTTNPRVFAIGDVAGAGHFTHLAEHHAGIVLRHVLFRLRRATPSRIVPWCTFTDPELARVGLSESEARRQRVPHAIYRFSIAENDRARAEAETSGFAKLVARPNGAILGAAIVGPHAGEIIAEYALAMQSGLKVGAISATIHAYPTWAQTNRRLADQRLKAALTPRRRAWLQRVFGWRGA